MDNKGEILRPNKQLSSQPMGTGRVREYQLGRGRRLFQITTFCPDLIGPGPTHLYLIEDDALILVDTGLPTDLAKNMFYYWRNQKIPADVETLADDHSEQELLSAIKLTGHEVGDIDFIVLTHGHPDHYLLGKKLVEMSGAKVAVHVSDTDQVSNSWGMIKFWVERRPMLMAMGMPLPTQGGRSRATVSLENTDLSLRVDCPIAFDGRLTLDGFEKDSICVRHFAGHSPGGIAIMLYDDEGKDAFMLCGDTLLYPITPHPDDLVAYIRTLKDMGKLQNIVFTLPAHGKAISKLSQRLDFLERHHKHRLQLTYNACKCPRSIWQIATMRGYFDVFVDPEKFNPLAGQETFVHVELLALANGLHRSHMDGFVHYFENSGENFEDVYARVQDILNDENTTALMRR
jgi:glyoxylase-like metal-dependent hydrolase (beta-lactamase superfamily II)